MPDGYNLGIIPLLSLLWEYRHSVIDSVLGKVAWGCGIIFLSWLAVPIEFGLNQHTGESYTSWICLIHMLLKNQQNRVFYFFCSVYGLFSGFYLDCHSYFAHKRTYQWIIVCGVSTGGSCCSDHFPTEGSANPWSECPGAFSLLVEVASP